MRENFVSWLQQHPFKKRHILHIHGTTGQRSLKTRSWTLTFEACTHWRPSAWKTRDIDEKMFMTRPVCRTGVLCLALESDTAFTRYTDSKNSSCQDANQHCKAETGCRPHARHPLQGRRTARTTTTPRTCFLLHSLKQ